MSRNFYIASAIGWRKHLFSLAPLVEPIVIAALFVLGAMR
jgi:hypothetical protein